MADLVDKLSSLKPFGKSKLRDNDDEGEEIQQGSVGGGGHSSHKTDIPKVDLRVSRALRSFLAHHKVLSEEDAALHSEDTPPAVKQLLDQPHTVIPRELLDTSHPLPEYFISSSHNTYLIAGQLYGTSSKDAYQTALRTGSRCVEIDAWDNEDDPEEPKVTHGYTLVSNIPFREVCRTIRQCLDEEIAEAKKHSYNSSPIFISLENHCGAQGQARLVQIMRDELGDLLLSKAVRQAGHEEQRGGEHITLADLGARVAIIVEYHFPNEPQDQDSGSDDSSSEEEEEKNARKAYKAKKQAQPPGGIIPELAELGVYAQSVKPRDNSWFEPGQLADGPHHHLINVSESGLAAHLPGKNAAIGAHNAHHLMRVYPKGTRISSSNLKPVPFWAIGAQICALNWQTFSTSNQLNAALFDGSEGYLLKPAALRAGGDGQLTKKGSRRLLRLHVAGATDIPITHSQEEERAKVKPYLTCSLYHPDGSQTEPPKRKTAPYRHHRLGFLHRDLDNPPATDPVWDEVLEWEYEESEMVFLRMLVKSDDSWARNPMFAVAAVRLSYVAEGWRFVRMLDMKGRVSSCTVLVRFEFVNL